MMLPALSIHAQDTPKEKEGYFRFSYGPKIGWGRSNMVFSDESASIILASTSASSTIFGVSTETKLLRKFAIQLEAQYTQKGATAYSGDKHKFRMIEVPVLLKFTDVEFNFMESIFTSGGFNLGVMAGPSYSLISSYRIKGENGSSQADLEEIKRSNWGIAFGSTAELEIAKSQRVALQIGGTIGLTDFYKNEYWYGTFNAFNTSLIYYFSLGKKPKTPENKH